ARIPRMEKASVISAMIIAGSSAKPEMKMKPKPIMMSITLWSTGPAPRSLNSGNSTAVTTIIPATRQAARKPKKMTKRRPISAIPSRHRHRAQRLPLAHRQFLGLGLQLPAGREDVAAARGTHRRGVAGIEDVFGELLDLVPIRAFVGRAR